MTTKGCLQSDPIKACKLPTTTDSTSLRLLPTKAFETESKHNSSALPLASTFPDSFSIVLNMPGLISANNTHQQSHGLPAVNHMEYQLFDEHDNYYRSPLAVVESWGAATTVVMYTYAHEHYRIYRQHVVVHTREGRTSSVVDRWHITVNGQSLAEVSTLPTLQSQGRVDPNHRWISHGEHVFGTDQARAREAQRVLDRFIRNHLREGGSCIRFEDLSGDPRFRTAEA